MECCRTMFGDIWNWYRHHRKTHVPRQLLMLLPFVHDTMCNPQTFTRTSFASILSATEGEDECMTRTIVQVLASSCLIFGLFKHDTAAKWRARLDMAGTILLHSIWNPHKSHQFRQCWCFQWATQQMQLVLHCEAWQRSRMPPFAISKVNWILLHILSWQYPRANPPSSSSCSHYTDRWIARNHR